MNNILAALLCINGHKNILVGSGSVSIFSGSVINWPPGSGSYGFTDPDTERNIYGSTTLQRRFLVQRRPISDLVRFPDGFRKFEREMTYFDLIRRLIDSDFVAQSNRIRSDVCNNAFAPSFFPDMHCGKIGL
jgi:hypothetical protein